MEEPIIPTGKELKATELLNLYEEKRSYEKKLSELQSYEGRQAPIRFMDSQYLGQESNDNFMTFNRNPADARVLGSKELFEKVRLLIAEDFKTMLEEVNKKIENFKID